MKAFVVNRFGDFGFLIGLFLLFWGLGGAWAPPTSKYDPGTGRFAGAVPRQRGRGRRSAERATAGARSGPTLNFRELRDQVVIEEHRASPSALKDETVWGFAAAGAHRHLPLRRRHRQERADPALRLAARRDGRSRRRSPRSSTPPPWSPPASTWWRGSTSSSRSRPAAMTCGRLHRRAHRALRRLDRLLPVRHQEGPRLLAPSRQLGFMFIGVGVGAYWAGVFHLLTHAFFKACLFLGSGSVILGCHHEQDMRKMGGLKRVHAASRAGPTSSRAGPSPAFPLAQRLLLEGRDPLEGVHLRAPRAVRLPDALARAGHLPGRHHRRDRDQLLHVPQLLHDLHRRVPRRRRPRARARRGSARRDGGAAPRRLAAAPRRAPRPDPRHGHVHAGHGAAPHVAHGVPRRPRATRRTSRPGPSRSCWPRWPPARCWPASSASRRLDRPRAAARALARAGPHRRGAPSPHKPHALEYLFQAIGGLGAGAIGFFFAWLLYKDGKSTVPAR